MTNLDVKPREEILNNLVQAINDNSPEAYQVAMAELAGSIEQSVLRDAQNTIHQSMEIMDTTVLAQRGLRQLTTEEKQYFEKVGEAMRSNNPQQALTDLDIVMPKTEIDNIFDDLQSQHPLLSGVTFVNTTGLTEWMLNTSGVQLAQWGPITEAYKKELSSGFEKITMTLYSLLCYIPISKAMLDLGPVWLERYIRTILTEAIFAGLEDGIVNGDGNDKPIGIIADLEKGTASAGKTTYPPKATITATTLDPVTYGGLISKLTTGKNGHKRPATGLALIVNPTDYYTKIMPATTMLVPGGGYVNNVLPVPTNIIQSASVAEGKAVLGLLPKYFMGMGTTSSGKIEYSDEVKFIERERVYGTYLYGNGRPMDNNAFLYLDISKLKPLTYKVETVTATTPEAGA